MYLVQEFGFVIDLVVVVMVLVVGVKSYNGVIGVDVNKQFVEFVL